MVGDLKFPSFIKTIDPVGYIDFLALQNHAKLVMTDSGGVQEESCVLGTPCVTLRDRTERPETVSIGANILAGNDPQKITHSALDLIKKKGWQHPFGNGTAAKNIVDILERTGRFE
jgi:UDP-N-acetylglucosamine 2-epimerase (non-hydrolysing)